MPLIVGDLCPTCGAQRGLKRWADGSTRRNVRRPRCQPIAFAIVDAFLEDDEMGAVEAYLELSNHAERAFVSGFLSNEQGRWLRAALYRSGE